MDSQKQFACRVIADHARSTAFAITDGILPGNEGRNYVLRKIMRRAIFHGREHLGFTEPFFYKVCDFVIGEMKEAFPELEVQRDFVLKMVRMEEERFGNTLSVGLKKLSETLDEFDLEKFSPVEDYEALSAAHGGTVEEFQDLLKNSDKLVEMAKSPELLDKLGESMTDEMRAQLGGPEGLVEKMQELFSNKEIMANAAKVVESEETPLYRNLATLYDTYGVPKDLIRVKLIEALGADVPEDLFDASFDASLKQLQEQGNIGKTEQSSKINPIYKELEDAGFSTEFLGYETTVAEDVQVTAIVKDGARFEQLEEGDEGLVVLDRTPFYAESGGQVGDTGFLRSQDSETGIQVLKVMDTFAPVAGISLHKSKVEKGSLRVGDKVSAIVDDAKRDATRRNHTATHLVHAALKEVLGTHVKQAGSIVAPNYLRFDFTHYQSMSASEVEEVEDLVNHYILQNDAVSTDMMSIEDAMKSGAVAMFGEKYGSEVRVLSVGDGEFSKELCGGTHVRFTGDIGSFKITADEAIASGVRRIRAITGFDAFERFRADERLIDDSLDVLKTQRDQLPNAVAKLLDDLKKAKKENEQLKLKIATGAVGNGDSADEPKDVNGVKVLTKVVEDLDKSAMRHLSDTMMDKVKSGVVVIGNKGENKVGLIVRVSDDLTDKVKAGNVIKDIAPVVGGRGGGRPDMAEGGGSQPENIEKAIEASYEAIEGMLG